MFRICSFFELLNSSFPKKSYQVTGYFFSTVLHHVPHGVSSPLVGAFHPESESCV